MAAIAVDSQKEWQELRRQYEDEEIARFLDVFRLYVNEVRLPGSPTVEQIVGTSLIDDDHGEGTGEWTAVHRHDRPPINTPVASSPVLPTLSQNHDPPSGLAENIAFNYVVPLLPDAGMPPKPPFTFGRFRLSLQRLYLAIVRPYWPLLKYIWNLATWKDKQTSLLFCTSYWILCFYDLILPAAVFCVLYALVRRRIFPYPSLKELREHRAQLAAANQFSDEISSRLGTSSGFGVKDMWRIFRVVTRTPKRRSPKSSVSPKGKGVASVADEDPLDLETPTSPTVLDSKESTPEEMDFKRDALYMLDQFIDFNERIINIFIWRRPNPSRIFGGVMFSIFLATLLLPAHYVAKLVYCTLGLVFWHVIPIMVALTPEQRSRLPPPLSSVPTDAEYAMEMISRRIAAGQDVVPPKRTTSKTRSRAGTVTAPDDGASPDMEASSSKSSGVDWKKLNNKVALGKHWAEEGKRLLSGKEWQETGTWPPRGPLLPPAMAYAQPGSSGEVHSFPATLSSSPGLMTVTSTSVMFTQLMVWAPKLNIPLNDLRAVKKVGLLKGLSVLWFDRNTGEEREEKFKWVGNRDELFARLVGASEGRRWMKT